VSIHKIKHIAAFAYLALAWGAAQAAATYCAGNTDGLAVSDVTYSINGPAVGPFAPSTDCYGVVIGNVSSAADVNDLGLTWGSDFLFGDANNAVTGPVSLFGGSFTFMLDAAAGTSGTYLLTATDNNGAVLPNFPLALDFIVGLKGGNRFALYFFDDVVFDGSGGGAWTIAFENGGQQIPNLSHMAVLVREGQREEECTVNCGPQEVPEPGTLALVGLGMAGIGFAGRRRKAAGRA
jgi:hypothetical protein